MKTKINNRTEFLLTFFKEDEEYTEREVNGFWLIKQWNGATNDWQVSVYTKEAFKNYQEGRAKWQEAQRQQNHLFDISREV